MHHLLILASFWPNEWKFISHDIWHPLHGNGYQFWSGLAGIGIWSVAVTHWRKHNCHVRRCLRLGRFSVDGTPYVVCKKHHPDVPNKAPTAEHIEEQYSNGNGNTEQHS